MGKPPVCFIHPRIKNRGGIVAPCSFVCFISFIMCSNNSSMGTVSFWNRQPPSCCKAVAPFRTLRVVSQMMLAMLILSVVRLAEPGVGLVVRDSRPGRALLRGILGGPCSILIGGRVWGA